MLFARSRQGCPRLACAHVLGGGETGEGGARQATHPAGSQPRGVLLCAGPNWAGRWAGERRGPPPGARILLKTSSQDRKSTRLNSSHHSISYAVFCLKKTSISNGLRVTFLAPHALLSLHHVERAM